MSRKEIKTFVFFDLEGTGLTDNPRITEISMIAINRVAGMEMVFKARKNLWAPGLPEGPPDLPRVQNKLTVCIYPMKPVCFEAAEITGKLLVLTVSLLVCSVHHTDQSCFSNFLLYIIFF
jgi:hypothetical protein